MHINVCRLPNRLVMRPWSDLDEHQHGNFKITGPDEECKKYAIGELQMHMADTDTVLVWAFKLVLSELIDTLLSKDFTEYYLLPVDVGRRKLSCTSKCRHWKFHCTSRRRLEN